MRQTAGNGAEPTVTLICPECGSEVTVTARFLRDELLPSRGDVWICRASGRWHRVPRGQWRAKGGWGPAMATVRALAP